MFTPAKPSALRSQILLGNLSSRGSWARPAFSSHPFLGKVEPPGSQPELCISVAGQGRRRHGALHLVLVLSADVPLPTLSGQAPGTTSLAAAPCLLR